MILLLSLSHALTLYSMNSDITIHKIPLDFIFEESCMVMTLSWPLSFRFMGQKGVIEGSRIHSTCQHYMLITEELELHSIWLTYHRVVPPVALGRQGVVVIWITVCSVRTYSSPVFITLAESIRFRWRSDIYKLLHSVLNNLLTLCNIWVSTRNVFSVAGQVWN